MLTKELACEVLHVLERHGAAAARLELHVEGLSQLWPQHLLRNLEWYSALQREHTGDDMVCQSAHEHCHGKVNRRKQGSYGVCESIIPEDGGESVALLITMNSDDNRQRQRLLDKQTKRRVLHKLRFITLTGNLHAGLQATTRTERFCVNESAFDIFPLPTHPYITNELPFSYRELTLEEDGKFLLGHCLVSFLFCASNSFQCLRG